MPSYAADFVTKFSEPLEKFMTAGITSLASAVQGPLYAGAFLYIVIFGILILLGYIKAPIQDFVINVFKITLIYLLVTKTSEYNFYIKDLFFNYLPNGISSAIGQVPGSATSASNVTNGNAFDTVFNQLIDFSALVYKQWTWDNWYPLVASCIVLLGLIPISALLGIVLLSKVGLSLILVLGPVFIALYLFRPTQSFTTAWVSALVNFVTLQILAITFVTLLMSIMTDFVKNTNGLTGGAQLGAAFSIILIFVLALVLALHLPAISSQLAGGGFQIGAGLISAGVNGSRATANAAKTGAQKGIQKGLAKLASARSGGSMKKE